MYPELKVKMDFGKNNLETEGKILSLSDSNNSTDSNLI